MGAIALAAALGVSGCSGSGDDASRGGPDADERIAYSTMLTMPDGVQVRLTIDEEVGSTSPATITGRRALRVGDEEREIELRRKGARNLASATRVKTIVGAYGTLDVYADVRLPEYELLSMAVGDWTLSTVDPVASPLAPTQRQLLADSLHVAENDTDQPSIAFDAPLESSALTSPSLDVEFSRWKVTLRTVPCDGNTRAVNDEARIGSACKSGVQMDVWSDTNGPEVEQLLDHITPTILVS